MRFVGAHSVRPRADNVRPYIKAAESTLAIFKEILMKAKRSFNPAVVH